MQNNQNSMFYWVYRIATITETFIHSGTLFSWTWSNVLKLITYWMAAMLLMISGMTVLPYMFHLAYNDMVGNETLHDLYQHLENQLPWNQKATVSWSFWGLAGYMTVLMNNHAGEMVDTWQNQPDVWSAMTDSGLFIYHSISNHAYEFTNSVLSGNLDTVMNTNFVNELWDFLPSLKSHADGAYNAWVTMLTNYFSSMLPHYLGWMPSILVEWMSNMTATGVTLWIIREMMSYFTGW